MLPPLPPWEEMSPQTFLDHRGRPIHIFLQHDLPYRETISSIIQWTGGNPCSSPPELGFLVVDADMESGRSIVQEYGSTRNQMVVHAGWLALCIIAGRPVIGEDWGGCRLRPPTPANSKDQVKETQE